MTGLVFAGCKKEEENKGNGTLAPAQKQRALVVYTTGTWCGYCPNGSEKAVQAEHTFGNDMVVLTVHSGDPLSNGTADALGSNFPASGVPNFYVGNTNAGQSIDGAINALINQSPMAGVGHNWTRSGDKINVKARVRFYENGTGNYFMNSYFVQGDIEAAGNLTQSDFTDRLEDVDGVTKWKVDAAPVNSGGSQTYLIKAGDTYIHHSTLSAHADGLGIWGEAIPVTPTAGDEYTMNFTITIPANAATNGMKVVTVLWKDNGSGGAEVINVYRQ